MTTSKLKPRLVVEYNHIGQFRSGVRKKAWAAIRMSAINILSNTVAITPWKTGNLRDSYTVVEDEANFVVYVGTNVEYAPHVEFGTFRSTAKPHLFPSADQEEPFFLDSMARIAK